MNTRKFTFTIFLTLAIFKIYGQNSITGNYEYWTGATEGNGQIIEIHPDSSVKIFRSYYGETRLDKSGKWIVKSDTLKLYLQNIVTNFENELLILKIVNANVLGEFPIFEGDTIINGDKIGYIYSGKYWTKTKTYYANGNIKSKGHFESSYDTTRTGEWTFYYENGTIMTEGHYKNGKKYGQWTKYAENGEVK